MRVLYDGGIYSLQSVGGINRYFAELIARVPSPFTPIVVSEARPGLHMPRHRAIELHVREKPSGGGWSRRLAKAYQRVWLERSFRAAAADVLHPTYYRLSPGLDSAARHLPRVVTVHDLIDEKFAPIADPSGRLAELKRRAVEAADVVICISESTRRDLMRILGVPERKIRVIPLASDLHAVEPSGVDYAPGAPYFLYVGARWEYKNFTLALQALQAVTQRRSDVKLCVVGRRFTPQEQETIAALGLERAVLHAGLCGDRELARLYRSSVGFVHTSRYEGFGLPLLEAMGCGAPVIAADTSSVPEVLGDAGLRFSSGSRDELVERMFSLLDEPALRERLIAGGKSRVRRFCWDRMAASTAEVYRALAGSSPVETTAGLRRSMLEPTRVLPLL